MQICKKTLSGKIVGVCKSQDDGRRLDSKGSVKGIDPRDLGTISVFIKIHQQMRNNGKYFP